MPNYNTLGAFLQGLNKGRQPMLDARLLQQQAKEQQARDLQMAMVRMKMEEEQKRRERERTQAEALEEDIVKRKREQQEQEELGRLLLNILPRQQGQTIPQFSPSPLSPPTLTRQPGGFQSGLGNLPANISPEQLGLMGQKFGKDIFPPAQLPPIPAGLLPSKVTREGITYEKPEKEKEPSASEKLNEKKLEIIGRIEKDPTSVSEEEKAFAGLRAPALFTITSTSEGLVAVDKRDPTKVTPLGLTKPISSEQADTIASIMTLQDAFQRVKDNYNEKYVGPIAGRKGGLAGVVGIGTTQEEQAFRAQVAELTKILYSLSGKQINKDEFQRMRPYIPEVNDSSVRFNAKLKEFEIQLNNVLENKKKAFEGTGMGINIPIQGQTGNKVGRFTVEEIQ